MRGRVPGHKEGWVSLSSSDGCNAHFLRMKGFGFLDPFMQCGRDGGHGENHGGNLLVNSKGKMINEGGLIRDPCFGGKVLEVGDEFLETIIEGPVFLLEGLLGEFGKVGVSGGFNVKGVKGGFEIFSKFIKGLFFGINAGVGHSVIPHFREVNASTLTHLVQGSHDFNLIGEVQFGVDSEVGPHGLDPAYGIHRITREVSGESCFKLGGG